MEKFKTGVGQVILVHNKDDCEGTYCCIHNPSDHHMKGWPLLWRADRRLMERVCKCGIGHPDPDDLAFKKAMAEKFGRKDYDTGAQGCCGCCTKKKNKFCTANKKQNYIE